jgi:hypothetical protein
VLALGGSVLGWAGSKGRQSEPAVLQADVHGDGKNRALRPRADRAPDPRTLGPQGDVDVLVEDARKMAVEVEHKVASANVFADQVCRSVLGTCSAAAAATQPSLCSAGSAVLSVVLRCLPPLGTAVCVPSCPRTVVQNPKPPKTSSGRC